MLRMFRRVLLNNKGSSAASLYNFIVGAAAGGVEVANTLTSWATKSIASITPYIGAIYKCADGRYLLGSSASRTIYVTKDFITYTPLVLPGSGNYAIFDFAYGNGVLIAVGGGGFIWRSTDEGLTWTSIASSMTGSITGIVFSNGRFVFSGDNSKIGLSTDNGLNWSIISISTQAASQHLTSIAAAPDGTLMVLCSYYRYSIISTDGGNTWTRKSVVTNTNAIVTYFKGLWIAGCDTYANMYVSSDNGQTWVAKPLPSVMNVNNFDSNDNIILAVGGNGKIVKSTDGMVWSGVAAPLTTTLYVVYVDK